MGLSDYEQVSLFVESFKEEEVKINNYFISISWKLTKIYCYISN